MEEENTKNKGISRVDSGSTHGWFVRGYRNGRTFSKLFSDNKFENKKASLEAARLFRDGLFSEIEKVPKRQRARRIVRSDTRNKTGVIGVCYTVKTSPNGTKHPCYSVSWRPTLGVQKCTSFSIKKYGKKKAFQLAVAHRKKMLKKIQNDHRAY